MIVDFCFNRKRVRDFLLVIYSDLDPILHRFRDIARGFLLKTATSHLSIQNLGCSPGLDRRC